MAGLFRPAAGTAEPAWVQGLWPAIIVHALAGLPWVVWLVGQGLSWVETELEEQALLDAGPWRVYWHVTLPRGRLAVLAATLWVALQAASEVAITYTFQVRTYAEEVYFQFGAADRAAWARSVAVSLPQAVLAAVLVGWVVHRWERHGAPLQLFPQDRPLLRLGWPRWLWLGAGLGAVALVTGVVLASLVWKAGLAGSPQAWSAAAARGAVASELRHNGYLVIRSLLLAVVTGGLAAGIALVCCWLAVGARWFAAGLFALLAMAWAFPGPVLGIGLKETIDLLAAGEEKILDFLHRPGYGPLSRLLYYDPSPLPVLWAHLVRFLPCAVAVLWPVVRLLPRELPEAARVDGAGPGRELVRVILPLTAPACLAAGLAVAVLALGELSAGKLVAIPGWWTFTHEVFQQMHYGVTSNLAALCLILLGMVALGGALVALAVVRVGRAPLQRGEGAKPR